MEAAPERLSPAEARFDRARRRIGLVAAPLAAIALLAAPMPGLSDEAHRMAAVAVLTVILWVTEAIPLAVAAMLGPALAVALGVAPAEETLAPFAHPLIFLFLGGFMLAQGLSEQGFDRRATLWLLSRGFMAGSPTRAMVSVALVTWGFSLWISNTATTAMMMPIALGLCATIERFCPDEPDARRALRRFTEGLLITMGYAASIGGTGTPIGTATNLIAIELLDEHVGVRIDFLQWTAFGLPISLGLLAIMLRFATLRFRPPVARVAGLTEHVRAELAAMGPMSNGERRVVAVFSLAIAGWVAPPVLRLALGAEHPASRWAEHSFSEGIVAVLATAILFALPAGAPTGPGAPAPRLVTWERASRIDWGTLLLLGGGFSLSHLVFETGLAAAIGDGVLGGRGLAAGGVGLLVLATALVLYLTELSSNTATISMMLPVILPIALRGGVDPVPVALCTTFAASFAFMLPVSTPPNAIVYGSGRVRLGTMIRYGSWMNILALAYLVLLGLSVLARLPLSAR